jgi:hypothetical protein
MNDITLNLIVILVVGLLVILIFVLVRRNRSEQEKRLAQMALERGWTLEVVRERLVYGQHLHHKQWTMELLNTSTGTSAAPGSSTVVSSTVWRAAQTGSTILIGRRTSQVNLGGLGDSLIRQVLQMALGSGADGLVEVSAGTENFRKHFMIWAKDPETAKKLVTPFFESAMLKWKNASPMVKRTTEGLNIELRDTRLKKVEDIDTLVKLGELLLSQE